MSGVIQHALDLQREGRLDEAARLYREVLAANPGDAQALHHLGLVEQAQGRLTDAIDLISRAIAIDGGDAAMHSNLGEACRRAGDEARAFTHFKRALELDPHLPVAHVNLGVLMRSQGKLPEAEHFLFQATMLFPDMAKAHMELGRVYLDEDRVAEAVECLRSAVALRPADAEPRYLLGAALMALGDTRAALAEYRVARDLGHRAAALEVPRLCLELGWEREAVESYRALQPGSDRVVTATQCRLQRFCPERELPFTAMAEEQRQPFDLTPPTLPEAAAAAWYGGRAYVPPAFLGWVRDAEVLRPGFAVLAGGHIMLEGIVSAYQHYANRDGHARFAADDGRMLLDLGAKPRRHDGRALLLGGGGNRYRWLYESMARLWFAEQQPALHGLPLVVSSDLGADEREMLTVAAGREPELLPVGHGATLAVAELAVPSLMSLNDNVSPLAIQFLRRKFSRPVTQRSAPSRRIYLSRRSAATRRVANEAELLPVLQRHGFEILDAATLGWRDRLALLEEAAAVVGLDDESLADLFIVPQGARVGAIAAEGLVSAQAWLVSAQLGHRFRYLVGSVRFGSHARHEDCDIELNPALLEQFLSMT